MSPLHAVPPSIDQHDTACTMGIMIKRYLPPSVASRRTRVHVLQSYNKTVQI